MTKAILEITNLRKEYPRFTLDDINLSVAQGYIMGLIGPNGAGKTTTIKAIMNLINIDGGQIRVFGKDHREYEREIKSQIGYTGEAQHFYEELTCLWHAKFVSKYYPIWDHALYRKLMGKFQVDENKAIKQLSKGMKMKFSLALALSHHPRLLLFDEPTSGLDPIVRHELLQEMLEVIQDESRSIIFSTHITEDIAKISDYVTIINEGKIIESDSKESISDRYRLVRIKKDVAARIKKDQFIARKNAGDMLLGITRYCQELNNWHYQTLGTNLQSEPISLDALLLALVRGEM